MNIRIVKSLFLPVFILSIVGCAGTLSTPTIDVAVPGYKAEVGVHNAKGKPKDIVVISLHGKEKGRGHDSNIYFAHELAKAGYTTYTPQMPWYDYSADVDTVFAYLDALIKKVATTGKKVVVTGHSQGAPYAFFYTTAYEPPPNVVGAVLLAPGHLVHQNRKIQEQTVDSVLRARKLVKAGKGDEKNSFTDFNGGGGVGGKSVVSTARIYLTYFDPGTSLNFLELIKQARLPILWVDGKADHVRIRHDYKDIYDTARKHPQNRYVLVDGGHVDMWDVSFVPVIDWLKQFE